MFKNLDRWILNHVYHQIKAHYRRAKVRTKKTHIMFCSVDHYEPDWHNASMDEQQKRVQRWVDEFYPIASRHGDADQCFPKHTFFFPIEVYNEDHITKLKSICEYSIGEVEIHLHHDGDSEESLRKLLLTGRDQLAQHGLLGRRTISNQIKYAFIHGNWCLNNSRSDGRWCGVNDESRILKETGCYADFTYPSAPDATQPSKINSLYYTSSNSKSGNSHKKGKDVTVNTFTEADLMIIQGPLTLNWRDRKSGFIPRIENGDLTGANPPTPHRINLWVQQHICVKGREDWIFIKVHTHGAPEKNATMLLEYGFDQMYSYLEDHYNDGKQYALHYVSAREMYNIIKAAEAGETGEPGLYRNYMIGVS